MTTVDASATSREAQLFIGGEWAASATGGTFEARDPFTASRRDTVPRDPSRRRARGRRRARPRFPRVGGDAARRHAGDLPAGGRRPREPAATRSSTCSPARPAARSASGCSRSCSRPGCCARRRASPTRRSARSSPPTFPGVDRDGPAPAGRRRRRDRAVERGADPLRCARSRRRSRSATRSCSSRPSGRRSPAGCSGARSSPRRACPPGCSTSSRTRRARPAPIARRARREPARAADQLHRLDGDRPPARRGGGPAPEARRARARRLEPADRARRRRPRLRGRRGGLRRVPPPGPDLHVGAADHRRAPDRGRRSSSRLVEKTSRAQGGRPEGARHDHRAAHQRAGAVDGEAPRRRRRRRGAPACSPAARPSARATGRRCWRTCRPTPTFASEETFGPVAAIEVVDDADEAVARANATGYGLSAGIITSDTDRGLALARQIESGIVHVNDQPVGDEPQMPFGGVKDSGCGPLRRPRRDGRVHRAALGHRPERIAALPVLGRRANPMRVTMTAARDHAPRRPSPHIRSGDTVMVGGFGLVGAPLTLDRRARRALGRDRPDDRLEQHRRAGPRPRQAAAAGPDPARDLVVLHVEPRGRGGRERRRDRGDAAPAGHVRRGDPRGRRRHRRLLHARSAAGHAARGGQGGARDRRRAARARARRSAPTWRSSTPPARTRSATSGTGAPPATSTR